MSDSLGCLACPRNSHYGQYVPYIARLHRGWEPTKALRPQRMAERRGRHPGRRQAVQVAGQRATPCSILLRTWDWAVLALAERCHRPGAVPWSVAGQPMSSGTNTIYLRDYSCALP